MELPMRERRRGSGKKSALDTSESSSRVQAAANRLTVRVGGIRLAWRFILVAVLVALASIIWLSQTSTLVSMGYEIENMQKQKVVLNRQAELLQSQIAQYENPRRIEDEARSKLGMVPAKNSVYVKVPPAQAQAAQETQTNPDLTGPVTVWWRELVEMLPRSFRAGPNTTDNSK